MTDRLYYSDAYLTAFEARVVARAEAGRRIYLDRSAFYPASGGQPSDYGSLGGVPVLDVVDEDERVAHVLASPFTGDTVDGTIDWARRFDHMQQHTGQHLLSAVFADLFGHETASVHFGPENATLDLATESVSAEQVLAAEARTNEVVAEDRAVTVSFEDADAATGLRKPSERGGMLRIVTIAGIDRSACGGTHVRTTGAIGPIFLRRQEKMRKQVRIEFLCGARAVRRARADYSVLAAMASAASASIDELGTIVPAQFEQLRAAEGARRKLEEEVAGYRARARWEATPADADGVRWIVERRATGGAEEVRAFALAVSNLPKTVYAALFDTPRSLLVASSADSGVEAGKRVKDALSAAGGKGGGSPRLAQGSVPDAESLRSAWLALGFPVALP
ncbi:MAG: alanyl-tRNA editing protein [Cytophagaceae bacterium]|nr:alanyl-tRNA editing protein [Gemmatimonadaceae bacterium]